MKKLVIIIFCVFLISCTSLMEPGTGHADYFEAFKVDDPVNRTPSVIEDVKFQPEKDDKQVEPVREIDNEDIEKDKNEEEGVQK